ncbi:MAG: hypothetical protein RL215_2053 [Planctomycetota bacterium]
MTVSALKPVPLHTHSNRLTSATLTAIALLIAAASGCQSLPQLHSPSGAAWSTAASVVQDDSRQQLFSAVPDFDQLAETSAQTQPGPAGTTGSVAPVAAPVPGRNAGADTTTSQSTAKSSLAPVPPANPTSTPADQTAGKATNPQNSPQTLPKFSERRPETFVWLRSGKSAGGRPFEIARSGTQGFRTLFVGSALGNDPAALQLIDKLAKHLHEHALILGGFETAVIRTLNPDGALSGQSVNALGRYVNGRFPPSPATAPAASTPEVGFLLESVRSFKPQRVIHIRTIAEQSGVIAASENAAETAQAVAAALKFSRLVYPEQARAGSLERCLSSEARFEVITLAIPSSDVSETDLWERYGDTLLNLIQPQSLPEREASREQQSKSTGSR